MIDLDLGGARPSNAGDEFHELWALRQALSLLDYQSSLCAVSVEGLRREDETGADSSIWDGVDCALYFGGDRLATATKIVIEQLKYSTAEPGARWTLARLCAATNQKKTNAVITGLATAFEKIHAKRPDLVPGSGLVVRLVSNQPIDPKVIAALSNDSNAPDYKTLRTASKLKAAMFKEFAAALDWSQASQTSRYALDDAVVRAISELTEEDARTSRDVLMRWIRRDLMMPDRPRDPIRREDLMIVIAGTDSPYALFPCEQDLKRIDDPIPRAAANTVLQHFLGGTQQLALRGEGGCGKTTALFEIEAGLPVGSEMVVYDCYGAGRYLNSNAPRHRPQDAFLQLANEFARRLRAPLLISKPERGEWPRAFKRRLDLASRLIANRNPQALLVIAIDAADNAVTAAKECVSGQPSFVRDLVRIGDLPSNVRILITARPGRFAELDLPEGFKPLDIGPFLPAETAAYARRRWPDAPAAWIEDLHELSGGNPRVQTYALDQAGADVAQAIDLLRPGGKTLEVVFRDSFNAALRKVGRPQEIATFCAALIGLPRPVPIRHLAAVTALDEAHVRDLIADLRTGGLRISGDVVSFIDEDLEEFVRQKAGNAVAAMAATIAEHLFAQRNSDAYAATHVTSVLLKAKRRTDVIALAKDESDLRVITDRVLRRVVQIQRLRSAMMVCREAGNLVDAAMTVLAGAEAVRTNAAAMTLLLDHPDLAVRFAPENVSEILRDPEKLSEHGSFLMHRMAEDARKGNGAAVREGLRQLQAWQARRDEAGREDEQDPWPTPIVNDAAVAEALCRIEGALEFQKRLRHWSHQSLLNLAFVVCRQIAAVGDYALLTDWLVTAPPRPFRFIPLTYLALAGQPIDLHELVSSLQRVARIGAIDPERIGLHSGHENVVADLHELFVTGCEIAINCDAEFTCISTLLDRLRPTSRRLRTQMVTTDQFALAMRAHALCETMAGRSKCADTFFVDQPDMETTHPGTVERLVKSMMPVYTTRARLLIGTAKLADLQLPSETGSYPPASHALIAQYESAAVACAHLCHVQGMVGPDLARFVIDCANSKQSSPIFGATRHLVVLALRPEWHEHVLEEVVRRRAEIRSLRSTASDKSGALIQLARILAPVNEADASAVFEKAVEAVAEADHDLVPALETLSKVTTGMVRGECRDIATELAVAACDIGQRLGRDMPWNAVTEALVRLDFGVACAAVARWDDEDVVHRRTTLSAVLTTGVATGTISPMRAVALAALMEYTPPEQTAAIVTACQRSKTAQRHAIAEELARDECLFHCRDRDDDDFEALQRFTGLMEAGCWVDALRERMQQLLRSRPDPSLGVPVPRELPERPDILASVDWRSTRWVTADVIDEALDRLLAQRQETGARFSAGDVLDRMANAVALGDRGAYLDAITLSRAEHLGDWERARILNRRLDQWGNSPAISRWCRERLPDVIAIDLPAYCHGLAKGEPTLTNLLTFAEADDRIGEVILDGIERNVDRLDAPTLYALVGVIAEHAPQATATAITRGFAARMASSIPAAYRSTFPTADIPKDPTEVIARFLYALMSDIEVPVRWRAAHAVRRLARFGDRAVIDSLVALLDRRDESGFRAPATPFYWLSARLWLLIALDRVASEAPQTLAPHAQRLLALATDETLPHVLMCAFAAAAVRKLVAAGAFSPNQAQSDALAAVNMPRLPTTSALPAYRGGLEHVSFDMIKHRRYSFDTTDTVLYWYKPASQIFADVSSENFLDIAERFIVDEWANGSVERAWDRQPRHNRLNRDGFSTSHRHGSLPSQERWDTHLEWHAMYCTVGTLLQTHALAEAGEFDDPDLLAGWLRRKGLTNPPEWLSDQLAPIPAEPALWREIANREAWLKEVTDVELDELIGLNAGDSIAVAGKWHLQDQQVNWTAEVMSALVLPMDIQALTTLSQSNRDGYSPEANDRDGPTSPRSGWLRNRTDDLGLDEHDPLRNGIRGDAYAPGLAVQQTLELTRTTEVGRLIWRRPDGDEAFISESWGDLAGDQDQRSMSYSNVHTDGHRLRVMRPALCAFLEAAGRDLIVQVTLIKRRNYRKSPNNKVRLERVCHYLLQRGGSFHTVDGPQGIWALPQDP